MAFWRDDGYPAPGPITRKQEAIIKRMVKKLAVAFRERREREISAMFKNTTEAP